MVFMFFQVEALYTFEPSQTELTGWLIAGAVVLVACVGAAYYFYRRKQEHWAMLLGFVGMTAAGTCIFSYATAERMAPVRILPNTLVVEEQPIPYRNLRNAYIEQDYVRSRMATDRILDTTRLLFVETTLDKELYILSEDNYPIDSILVRLREVVLPLREQRD